MHESGAYTIGSNFSFRNRQWQYMSAEHDKIGKIRLNECNQTVEMTQWYNEDKIHNNNHKQKQDNRTIEQN